MLRTRPMIVQAVQIGRDNRVALANWSGGLPLAGGLGVYQDGHMAYGSVGDWVIRNAFGEYRLVRDDRVFGIYEGVVTAVTE